MRHGLITVAAGTPTIRLADCAYNGDAIFQLYKEAAAAGAVVLALPELCITGYTCGDLFLQDALLDGAEAALQALVANTKGYSLVAVVGAPLRRGGALFNCGVVLQDGRVLGVIPKTHLPNYGEFYEARQFAPAPKENGVIRLFGASIPFGAKLLFECDTLPQLRLGVEVCEDLWVPAPPCTGLTLHGATVIANLSASDETIGKDAYRRLLVTSQSARLCCGYVYANAGAGESTGDLVFAGHNLISENGTLLAQTPPFGTGLCLTELDLNRLLYERRRMNTFPETRSETYDTIHFELPLRDTQLTRKIEKTPFLPEEITDKAARCEGVLRIQASGLSHRLAHTRSKTLVLGVSGGLDSTLALLVAARTMDMLNRPRADIIAVTMPCFGTTKRTRSNAERLCACLGIPCRTVDITKAVRQHFEDIGHEDDELDITYENAQARERTQVLMDIANAENGLVVGTGDLSELALGWATYNGDHMSMYGVNASVPKTLIRHILAYEAETSHNLEEAAVLLDILDTPVSPELLPATNGDGEVSQKTEDIVGPYALHDFFLYWLVRYGAAPEKILRLAVHAYQGEYDEDTIKKWLQTFCRRFFQQQFKRDCLPNGPKVGSVSLSPRGDWRMPSDANPTLWQVEPPSRI